MEKLVNLVNVEAEKYFRAKSIEGMLEDCRKTIIANNYIGEADIWVCLSDGEVMFTLSEYDDEKYAIMDDLAATNRPWFLACGVQGKCADSYC